MTLMSVSVSEYINQLGEDMVKKIILGIVLLMLLYKFYPNIVAFIDDIYVSDVATRSGQEKSDPATNKWTENPMGVKEKLDKSKKDRYSGSE